jgi:acyl carrier protein
MAEIERDVTTFIVDNFLFGNRADAPAPDVSFLETGLIDSTGILELVAFLESKYEITIADEELTPDNLDSVAAIVKFVERLRGA